MLLDFSYCIYYNIIYQKKANILLLSYDKPELQIRRMRILAGFTTAGLFCYNSCMTITYLSRAYNYLFLAKQKVFGVFREVLRFFHIRIYLVLLLAGNLALWLGTYYINVNVSQNLVVLHYNVDFGIDLIGEVKRIFIIPVFSLIIIFVNVFLLFNFLRRKDFKFISHLLLAAGLVANLFLFIALVSIYLINFR